MNGYWSVTLKEFLHLRRDPAVLIFALLIPVIQLTLFGFAIDFDVRYIQTVVVDLDRSRESRAYIDSLRNTQYIDVRAYSADVNEAERMLRSGAARVAIIVPPDFSRRGERERRSVRVMVDGSDSQVATRAIRAFQPPPDRSRHDFIDTRFDILYNPDMRTAEFIIPGLIGIIMQLVTVSLTSFSLVREKEQGTLEQVMVSPIGRLGLMLGKLTPYACLAFVEMLVVLLIGRYVFDVRVVGSVVFLMALSLPFVLAALAMGLLISTIAQTQGQALQMTMLTLLPSILLSGFMFPRETMPGPIYLLSFIFPVTFFIEALRGVIIRGAGPADLWPSVLALLILMVALIGAATVRFRKSLA